jgi:hypothetical protein
LVMRRRRSTTVDTTQIGRFCSPTNRSADRSLDPDRWASATL